MRKIKIILSCSFTLGLTILFLVQAGWLLERKDSAQRYADFFSEQENFDILFLGNSHMMNAVYPMELWDDYGIVSYNIAGQTNTIETSYWVLKNAMDYTTPKMVVIDCFGSMFGDNKTSIAGMSYIHLSLDAFPMSRNKIRAIADLIDDPAMDKMIEDGQVEDGSGRNMINFLWDFSVYHNRWDDIKETFFLYENSKEKGAMTLNEVAEPSPDRLEYSKDFGSFAGDNLGAEYLCSMIEELQEKEIQVVLTYLPFPVGESYIKESNTIKKIADKYGIDYINFLEMDIVDYSKDCADPSAHLNASGAKKITSFLGEYLQKKYPDIALNHKDDIKYSAWNGDYQEYLNEKNHLIQGEVDLNKYLMLLCDQDYDVTFQTADSNILEDSIYGKWFDGLNMNISVISEGDTCIKVISSKTEELVDSVIISNEKNISWKIVRD